ncbi:hypothetical protein [Methylobacterium sp. Leaf399]|uniref:hypothetical protein n=1 Tax=Methylobacterium sp. Leaf399 TaxID=1736364 RepID=UPI001FCD4065|nr:hypothetical protein [Methylobacterium sp. Leaf399]
MSQGMRVSTFAAVLVASAASLAEPAASAEDFTGFYAGVNAGYAFGKDTSEATSPAPVVTPGAPPSNATALPPSAANAARTMKAAPKAGPSLLR